jgi:transposase
MDLFPPRVRNLIADDHICLVINDVVDALDLSCIYTKVAHEGNPPYHLAMMLKILFYAYTKGIFSSRKIAAALK